MNILLIICIAILAVTAIIGLKKGLVQVLFSMLAGVLILGLTIVLAPKLAAAVEKKTDWDDAVYLQCEEYLDKNGILLDETATPTKDALATVRERLNWIAFPGSFVEDISENMDNQIAQGIASWNAYVVDQVGHAVFTVIVYVAMFVLAGLIVLVAYLILKALSKLPVIHAVNRFGGLVAGLIQGLFIVWLVMLVIAVLIHYGGVSVLYDQIESNGFVRFFYEKNPIMWLLFHFAGISV